MNPSIHPPHPRRIVTWIALLAATVIATTHAATDRLSLAGRWRFDLDRRDVGISEGWFARPLPRSIRLPGSIPGQGLGDPVGTNTPWIGGIVDRSWFTAPEYAPYRQPGHIKVPFWLQPATHYAGPAWYQRDVVIPEAWDGRRIVLTLERPHWETRVWIDRRFLGSQNALGTPHEYTVGALSPGRHILTIRVDNRMVVDIGENSHSISDHTQGNWNGIVGRLELQATPKLWIEDLQVFPHIATRSVTLRGKLGNLHAMPGSGSVELRIRPASAAAAPASPNSTLPLTWGAAGGDFETEIALGDSAQLWDEFHPALYQLSATLTPGGHTASIRFGLREFGTEGTQFVINGRKTFIRGTLECCIFPLTGHPPTELPAWRRILGVARAHGLNHLRFHSWCPPEAAFAAADELGFFLQVECSSWANQSTTLGDGKPVDAWIYAEADRILRYYGNHPSFVLMPYGNEPGGDHHVAYLKHWVEHYRRQDPRRLYTSGAGWPEIPENQFHLSPDPRIQAWGGGLKSRINARPPETVTDYRDYIRQRPVPVISHEIGQWCVYPNFAEIRKYRGYLKPRNFEIFQDRLRQQGLERFAPAFLAASGKLQTLCYKEEIESALRTPGMGGFQLLDLHDFPGQGTALVGVLDAFWDSKGYVRPAEYRRFCHSTVPLARLPQRVFTTEDDLDAELEMAHFGPAPLVQASTTWQLIGDDGRTVARGAVPARDIPVDNAVSLGHIQVDLGALPAPARYRLVAAVRAGGSGRPFENDWDLWLYPATAPGPIPSDITIVDRLDARAESVLDAGGKVLWLIPPDRVRGDRHGPVALGFSSIFWNTAWTGRQPPHTLGILCDPKHPALAQFPTDRHSNWQWWYLVHQAGAMILDGLPRQLDPVVRVIDDWVTARPLALVFEARVGAGRLVACSIDLQSNLATNPVARQLRQSLLSYMASRRFRPSTPVTADQLRGLIQP